MKELQQVSWISDMAFKTEVNGHQLILDATEKVGGKDQGPRPKPLMITSLLGCTAMDVISILQKMRVDVKAFRVYADSELTEEHPKHYDSIHLIFEFTGKNLPMDKLKKAVSLSEDRYCGVSYIYKQAIKMSSEIKVIEK